MSALDIQVDLKVYASSVTTAYQIKDVAERSGFTTATLRYYEEIGLLPQPTRTSAGYRRYDDRTLERLSFIARAKQLGCSLDEIADLALAWDGGECGPVQDRLRTVVADKLAGARRQIVELMTLTAELQRAAATLELHRPDGPCDDTCGCVSDNVAGPTTHDRAVALGAKPAATAAEATPIACTLAPTVMPGRFDEWEAVLAHVTARESIAGGIRATLGPAAPLADVIHLTAAEQECCRFFEFAVTVDRRGVALEVRAPDEALPVVHSLFGVPA